jgi:3-O-methylgallate 3,4-dioxygenase
MAEIVLGLGTSHSPQLSLTPETWPLHAENDKRNPHLYGLDGIHHTYEEVLAMVDPSIEKQLEPELWQKRYDICQAGLAAVSQKLVEANVDAVIVIGDDQEEVFQEDNFPAMAIYWGDTIVNIPDSLQAPLRRAAWAYGLEEKEYPVAKDLAEHMLGSLMEQEFDVARSRYFRKGQGMGHAFSFVYSRIMGDNLVPMVPVMLNTYFPPNQPTPERCWNFGKAIREAVSSWDSGTRVAVLGSGGFSHFVVDEEIDLHCLKLIEERDEQGVAALPTERLQAGTSEIRNWFAAAGAMGDDMEFDLFDYVPCYRSEAGTGCGMAFAKWS